MSIFNNNSAEILILIFFITTYFFSVVEKLGNWKATIAYYNNHFKKSIFQKVVPALLINVIFFETITVILLVVGLYFLVTKNEFLVAKVGLEISAITLLMFLVGQRVVKDYQGAMNITVYFILNIIGIYFLM
jgi:putative oxidoreductase